MISPSTTPTNYQPTGSVETQPAQAASSAGANDQRSAAKTPRAAGWIQTLARLADQPDRTAAMRTLVDELNRAFPDCIFRLGRGKSTLKELFDPRYGRLGIESSLFHELADKWHQAIEVEERFVFWNDREPSDWLCKLPTKAHAPHVVIWAHVTESSASPWRSEIECVGDALATVLASRPAVGVGHTKALLRARPWRVYGIAMLLVLCIAMLPIRYRVRCDATLEPVRQRVLAAPFDATIRTCHVRPGDHVTRDQVLVELDERPLRTEWEALCAEKAQADKKQSMALAAGQIADAQLADLQRRQLQYRIALLEQRLEQLVVRSPAEGIVLSGDLDRSVGSPVQLGQPLFEIAPLDALVVELAVPEVDIGYVDGSNPVSVRFYAMPHKRFTGSLSSIDPSASIRDSQNVFVGRWTIANDDDSLRPGMRGYASVLGPRRPLVWKWIRQLSEATQRTIGW